MANKKPAKRNSTAMAKVDPIFAEDANVDNNMSKDDIAIPRLVVLQALSPAAIKRDAEYVEGAEPGMLADLTQGKLFDGEKGVIVIPVSYRRSYIEWKPRTEGGGFVADHGIDEELLASAERNEKGALVLESGNNIVVTAEYIIMILEGGIATPAVLSLSSSQMKKAKRWNTMITNYMIDDGKGGHFNPAMFYRTYKIVTVPEKNDQGSWFGVSIHSDQDVIKLASGKEIYLQCRDFRQQIDSGAVKVTPPVADAEEDEDSPM